MPDLRVSKLARVLVHYSVNLKAGQQLQIRTHPLAEELTLAIYEEAIKTGAYVFIQNSVPGTEEIFYEHASDKQLDYISPIRKLIARTFDASITVWAESNTRSLSGADNKRIARFQKANTGINKVFYGRAARGDLHWSLTVFPNQAMAQEADMSLRRYQDFVYDAGMLGLADPVAYWRKEGKKYQRVANWLNGRDKVQLKGSNVDLTMSVKGRKFIPCSGTENFPDGEIFTAPVERSVNGWIRFRYPAIEYGQEVTDIELWFENGRIVKETATKNQDLLTSHLNTDAGARYLGEFGIGTNYNIQRFTKNMLFDEKMGGTIHLAAGFGYPETGSKNVSGIHWDMLCDMNDAEIKVDNDLFYRKGKVII